VARPPLTRRNFQRLYRLAGRLMLESGDIDATQLSEAELAKRIADHLALLADAPLEIAVDHKGKLLRTARLFARSNEMHLAILIAATWMEHWINGFILRRSDHMRLSVEQRNEMLRTVPLAGKCTWLLTILGSRPIAPAHIRHIRQLADERNAFVHYKWVFKDIDEDISATERKRMVRIFDVFEKTVKYLRHYDPTRPRRSATRRISKLAAGLPRLPAVAE
jgi:hypothetical protein